MLSEKQFRERARSELRQIGDQVRTLAIDRDCYRRLEREIIQPNRQLCNTRSHFLDLLRGNYADAMTSRALKLLGQKDGSPSLPRILAHLAEYPQLLHDRISEREFADDRGALERAAANLERINTTHGSHHERTLPALAAIHRELDADIDLLLTTVKTYYWIVADSYIDLDVKYTDNPLSIFDFAWAAPVAL